MIINLHLHNTFTCTCIRYYNHIFIIIFYLESIQLFLKLAAPFTKMTFSLTYFFIEPLNASLTLAYAIIQCNYLQVCAMYIFLNK